MIFNTLDWIIIAAFLAMSLFIGVYFRKSAGKGMENFFLGGRNLPWYIAGISMVATTFAADTPLAVTEIVAKDGISGNWIWWNALIGGTLTTFFFAKLWRRSHVLTEVELIEKRYSGKKAKFLRGFKSIYLGVFMNLMVIGWVNLAMITILQGFFPDLTKVDGILICGGLTIFILVYSTLSGLLGIAITDTIQFFIAIVGCIVLAILVVNSDAVGGVDELKANLPNGTLNFFPEIGETAKTSETLTIGLTTLIAFFGMVWWASWYPGAEPGGGGYVAQRMMSAKSEKDSVFATLFFQIGHYCIRPWPWILVALSAMVIYSVPKNIEDAELKSSYQTLLKKGVDEKVLFASEDDFKKLDQSSSLIEENKAEITQVRQKIEEESKNNTFLKHSLRYQNDYRFGFVYAIRDFLPNGLLGLLFVVFLAAYMSTISTQLNWGASYVVNDFYARFVNENASQPQLVLISRVTTLVLGIVGVGVSFFIDSISEVWKFIMEAGAGLGLVLILRWYWWRINAWSEISATIAPFVGYGLTRYALDLEFPDSFFFTVAFTTIVWILVTFITNPTKKEILEDFYKDVRPEGAWEPVRNSLGIEKDTSELGWLFLCWISAATMIYSTLFLIGKVIFKEWSLAGICLAVALVALFILQYSMRQTSLVKK
ncbi:sodium/glucose cotransporter [Flavobacteriaceae bacterium UJ101]|nr:sodium/glucose cotransporter [Flavobacteriaceae bacterium UJ101]